MYEKYKWSLQLVTDARDLGIQGFVSMVINSKFIR